MTADLRPNSEETENNVSKLASFIRIFDFPLTASSGDIKIVAEKITQIDIRNGKLTLNVRGNRDKSVKVSFLKEAEGWSGKFEIQGRDGVQTIMEKTAKTGGNMGISSIDSVYFGPYTLSVRGVNKQNTHVELSLTHAEGQQRIRTVIEDTCDIWTFF